MPVHCAHVHILYIHDLHTYMYMYNICTCTCMLAFICWEITAGLPKFQIITEGVGYAPVLPTNIL